jgi:hypothetical protein
MQISESGIDCLTEAVFAVDNPQVVEAYSEYDLDPISFSSSSELSNYIKQKLSFPKGLAYIYVVYPDMEGQAIKKKIELNQLEIPGHKFRYTWEGWGLISIQLAPPQSKLGSSVSANTEARAIKWAPTYPEYGSPSAWNWAAVKKHQNRLQRALKKHA